MPGVRKAYTNGEVTIVWQPDLCIHSKRCFDGLPQVFDPNRRPWIDPKAAASDVIVAQVRQCPSGALSLEADAGSPPRTAPASTVRVEPAKNGPLLVHGALQVRDAEGKLTARTGTTAFCRCGSSANKPYCDGSHGRVGFQG